jgi:hypothetical protein
MNRVKRRNAEDVNAEYLRWLRTRPCYICSRVLGKRQESVTEAAHVGDRGLGQKCPDLEAIPLCGIEHHREGKLSHHHLGRHFWDYWKLSKVEVLTTLHRAYGLLENELERSHVTA